MMKYRVLIFWLSVGMSVGNVLYWIGAFSGLTPVSEIVPGYTAWFWSFPLPDAWILVASVLLAIALKTKRDAMAAICGLLAASSMIFLSLNEIMFGLHTGMFSLPLSVIGTDLAIKVFNLSFGAFLITQCSRCIGRFGLDFERKTVID